MPDQTDSHYYAIIFVVDVTLFVMLVGFTIALPFFAFHTLSSKPLDPWDIAFLAGGTYILAWRWHDMLTTPIVIEIDDGRLVLRSVLHTRTRDVSDIAWIGNAQTSPPRLKMRFSRGRSVMLMSAYEEWDQFLDEVRSLNPNIVVQGRHLLSLPWPG